MAAATSDVSVRINPISRRRLLSSAVLTVAAVALSSCAAPATPAPSPAPAKAPATAPAAAPPTAAAPKPTAAATTAQAAKPAPTKAPAVKPAPAKVTFAQSTHTLSTAPLDVAMQKGFFKDEALEVEYQILGSGATVASALVSNEIQFAEFGSSDVVAAADKGLDFIAISQIAGGLTMTFAVRKEFAASKNVTARTPLAERVMALKGARIGLSSPAGAPTQYTKYIMKLYGLDPEKDADMNVVGFGPARRAALQNGQVDGFLGGVPDAETTEADGYGIVYIKPAEEIPIFKEFAWEVVAVKKEFAQKSPDLVERLARAIGRGNNYVQQNLAESKKIMKTVFPELGEPVIGSAMDGVLSAWKRDGKMTETQWKNASQVLLDVGNIKAMPNTAEDGMWTNKYIKNIPQ